MPSKPPPSRRFQGAMDSLNEVSHINYSQQKGKWPLMSYEEPGLGSIGYARVSTADQNADLQHAALKAAGCHRIFTARGVSESRASCPELDKMLDYLRDGDEVVVWKLDRLGRNTRKLLALIDDLERRGVHFRSVTEGISTTGRWAGPCRRSCRRSRSSSAISWPSGPGQACRGRRTRAEGRTAGSDCGPCERQACPRPEAQGLTPADIGKIIGASRATVYRYLRLESNEVL
jgi:hypothetical protein